MATLPPAEAERQYNARAAIPEHLQIFARWRARSDEARQHRRCECDYYYGPTGDETLDFFPAANPRSPLLLFVHGGYWRSLDKRDFSFLAPAFVDQGVAVALCNYALAPAAAIEDMVQQLLRACAWLWRNALGIGADFNRIYLAGHSAGAHLATMMATAEWPTYAPDLPPDLVRGVLAVSGIYDLEPLVTAPFLQPDLRLDRARARHLSPVSYRPGRPVPVCCAVGQAESDEFKRQAMLLRAAWPACVTRVLEVHGANHLTVVDRLADPADELFHAAVRLMRVA